MAANSASTSRPGSWRLRFERHGALIALVVIIVATAALELVLVPADSRGFLRAENFLNILRQQSLVGIVAIGMTFVIILGGIDLSVGAMVAALGGAALYAMNAVHGASGSAAWAIACAVAVCLIGGALLGYANGFAISKGRIAPFIATLGTMAIFRSAILAPAQGSEIRSTVASYGAIGAGSLFADSAYPLRVPVLVFAAVAGAAHLLLTRTVFGLNVYAIGDNARAARYAGIRVPRVTSAAYAICGVTCGISALLSSSRLNSVSTAQTGLFYELDAIAAVVIGGTRLQGGSGRIVGTVVGVILLGVVSNMLNMLQVSTFYQGLVKGCIIIAAVLVQPRKSDD